MTTDLSPASESPEVEEKIIDLTPGEFPNYNHQVQQIKQVLANMPSHFRKIVYLNLRKEFGVMPL